jgi:receptor-binding and translocation channel-forming TcA subunit of Tc toxin
MDIQGVVRQLPLFEPPIDPALLVKAAAAGVDLSSVIADLAVAPAPYRFRTLSQKALELCAEVKALGDKLLSALEKRDGEELALLRSSQEIALQKAVKTLKTQAVTEALHTQASLEQSRALAEQKKAFYESRDFLNTWEGIALALTGTSAAILGPIAVGYSLKGALALVPKVTAGGSGFGGSPHVTADPVDGKNLAESAASALQAVSTIAATLDKLGSIAATMGNYRRRQDDWRFQGELATSEIATIDKQILAAQVRAAIAEQDVENQDLQIEQFETADEFMRSKYTNQQLFDWQAKNVASVYFQGYQLAYDMAKRAEKCFQHERGDPSATFVQFGYWDSLKKGLLAGERLANDIRRMEAGYLEQNSRELEITKNVSLTQHFPLSLVMLKETGACTIVLPEWLFDLDYPGHYFRRLKSVALSIPSVVGPYTSINCTLSLTNHGIRVRTEVAGGYGDPLAGADDRFYKSAVPQSAIATSHGQSDNGMFELNFNDERFLPFEGAGAVSEWRLEMPRENNQFDPATMSDVILHVRYTARSSGDAGLIQTAKDNLAAVLPPLGVRMFVVNQELSDAWHRFLRPEAGRDQTLSFRVGREHLPFFLRGKANVNVTRVDLVVEGADGVGYTVELTPPGGAPSANAMDPDPSFGGRQSMSKAGFAPQAALLGEWHLKIQRTGAPDFKSLPPGELQNAYLVLGFKTS